VARAGFTTGNYLRVASSPLTAEYPYTFLVWAYPTAAVTAIETLLDIHLSSALTTRNAIQLRRSTSDTLSIRSCNATGTQVNATTATFNANAWNCCIAVADAGGTRKARLNGSDSSTSNIRSDIGSVNRLAVGVIWGTSVADAATNTTIAEVAVWNAELSTEELLALEAGMSPLLVRPASLASYIPLFARAGTGAEEAWVGESLSAVGAPTVVSDHPRIIYPSRKIWAPFSAGGGATTHDTTGALTGAGSTIAGSAAHIAIHGTSGALTGPGSSVVGSAARTRAHPTSGALTGPGAAIAGAASNFTVHGTSGALTGPGSVIDGEADHVVPGGTHDTSGALTGQGAVIAGSAAHIAIHGTSGALVGPGAVLDGSAARVAAAVTHDTSGALVGPGSVLSGLASGFASTLDLILKILSNRQELNAATGKFTLYDDDGTTVLYESNAWEDTAGTIPYRGKALRRIDALS